MDHERQTDEAGAEQDHAVTEAVTPHGGETAQSRRQMLRLGAGVTATALTVRPALAQAATSVLNCQIPVPESLYAGKGVAPDGSIVPAGAPGAQPGGRVFTGEQIKDALRGRSLPGTSREESQAYLNYIRRLQYGRSGFTCYASLQMPR